MKSRSLRPHCRFCCALLAASLVYGLGSRSSLALPPWQFMSFKKIDADPNKAYPLTQSNGPWMIMAITFHGDDAEAKSQQLVYELRKQYKLNAYCYARNYDYTQHGFEGRGLNPDGTPKAMHYLHAEKFEEVAVLVGDYHAIDDPDGQKTLAMLKKAQPDCLKKADDHPSNQPLAELFKFQKETLGIRKAGPLGDAFMTSNPMLPHEYFAPKGVDKLTLDMNRGVKYGLLDCPGRYTVRIATFTGRVVIDQRQIQALEHNKDTPLRSKNGEEESPLLEAAKKAHAMTEALRAQHVEAYEFHDRHTSLVTIGSFSSVGMPRADGKIEINPKIYEILKTYGADQSALAGGQATEGLKAKTVMCVVDGAKRPLPLDLQPMPVEVPKRSFSSDYQQTAAVR
jgi:hypothetical protein